jgi:hypothetical protein
MFSWEGKMLKRLSLTIAFLALLVCPLFSEDLTGPQNCSNELQADYYDCNDTYGYPNQQHADCAWDAFDTWEDCMGIIDPIAPKVAFGRPLFYITESDPNSPFAYDMKFTSDEASSNYYLTVLNGDGESYTVEDLRVKLNGSVVIPWDEITSATEWYETGVSVLEGQNTIYVETDTPVDGFVTVFVVDTPHAP